VIEAAGLRAGRFVQQAHIEKKFTAKSATVATVENTRAGFTSHPKDYTP